MPWSGERQRQRRGVMLPIVLCEWSVSSWDNEGNQGNYETISVSGSSRRGDNEATELGVIKHTIAKTICQISAAKFLNCFLNGFIVGLEWGREAGGWCCTFLSINVIYDVYVITMY